MAIAYDGYLNVLFTADLIRARDFYQDIMGLEQVSGTDGVDAFFKIGPDGLLLISNNTAGDLLSPGDVDREPARGARFVMATEVADVDAAYLELRDRGARFLRVPEDRPWGLRCAHFTDPDGNVWEIHTPIGGR
jgi:catechol 2,3-dioxygenase-like lactoylglutathione lyase family enzyme